MLLDAYAPGLTNNIQRLCWQRGYIVVTHGGGASMIVQTNDTGLHKDVRANFNDLQTCDPVLANWHGTWYPGHVLEVRDDDVIVYWAEAQHQLRTYTTSGDITRNSGGVPMEPKLTQIKNGEICSSAKAERHWSAMQGNCSRDGGSVSSVF